MFVLWQNSGKIFAYQEPLIIKGNLDLSNIW